MSVHLSIPVKDINIRKSMIQLKNISFFQIKTATEERR